MRTPRGSRAFTLVELLVAIALGTILIGVVTFVWMQSNRIFSSTVNNLEAYQRLRTVLDIIERDLANTNRSIDMEFFQDQNANGHRDPGEQLLRAGGPNAGPAPAPSPGYRAPTDPIDPVNGKPEFFEGGNDGSWVGGSANASFSSFDYFYGPVLFSPPPYQIEGEGYLESRYYWRDEAYVRTFVVAEGATQPAMVHYRLVPQADGRCALRRRIWYTDSSGGIVSPVSDPSRATDRFSLLATGLCDLKFGFFFKESATGASPEGVWYHVGDPVQPDGGLLRRADEERGFRAARGGASQISSQHGSQFGQGNAVGFWYQGAARIEDTAGYPPLLRTISSVSDDFVVTGVSNNVGRPGGQSMEKYTNFDFPGVRPGDKIYLFNAQEDDASFFTPPRGPGDAAGTVFPDQTFTVDEIFSDSSQVFIAVKLKEAINFYQLRRRWLGTNEVGDGSNPTTISEAACEIDSSNWGTRGGPARTIRGSFNVEYRLSFLPPAFLVRLSIDDRYNKQVRQLERVIRLLQH